MMWSQLCLILVVVWLVGCASPPARTGMQEALPNVVLIIGDDQGWPDYGFMRSSRKLVTRQGPRPINQIVSTPSLDALAAGGVVYTHAFLTSSVCRSSLQTLLTAAGLQPLQWADKRAALDGLPQIELSRNAPLFFPRHEVEHFRTLPRELGRYGYKSWQGGKYWESTFERGGFTHGLAGTEGSLLAPDGWDFGRAGWDPALCGPEGDPHIPCPALGSLREFLDTVQGSPFFIWFAPQLPHTPFNAPQNLRDPYEALGLDTCAQSGCPIDCGVCATEVNYLANVSWLDSLVGELVRELENRNLRQNTLLIFLTDNGWGLNFQFFHGQGKGKNTLYEMGFRTPMIFNWPGNIPGGAVYDDLVSSTDIAPTLFDYAGIDMLPEQQGLSLRQRLEGGLQVGRKEVIGFQEGVGHFLRTDTWRYLRFAEDGREELYRIDTDPFEENNLAPLYPRLLSQYASAVDAWESDKRNPPAKLEISGRLLDVETGEPLSGAQLRLENGTSPLVSVVGAGGWFRFGPLDPGHYALYADRRLEQLDWLGTGEPVPVSIPLAATGAFLNLTGRQRFPADIPFSTQIRGTLRSAAGEPLPDVLVTIRGVAGGHVVKTVVSTQDDGSYRAENLPVATYSMTAEPAGFRVVVGEVLVPGAAEVVFQDLVAYPE